MITKEEYELAMKIIASYMPLDPTPESVYGKRLVELATLVEEYEAFHFPIGAVNIKEGGS